MSEDKINNIIMVKYILLDTEMIIIVYMLVQQFNHYINDFINTNQNITEKMIKYIIVCYIKFVS